MSTSNAEHLLTPIAYLWTRTVLCPRSNCGAIVPLVQQTWLCKRGDNCVALRALPDRTTKSFRFEVVQACEVDKLGFDPGTNNKRRNAICLHCGTPVNVEYAKTQGQNGDIGQKLMAVVYTQQANPGKIYLADKDIPDCVDQDDLLARADALCDECEASLPIELVPQHLTGGMSYGLTRFKDLFAPRQLLSLLAFTVEVRHAYHAMLDNGMEPERAAAITTYLGVIINHLANHNSSICRWDHTYEMSRQTYERQVLPMAWNFAEINPCTEGPGSPTSALNWIISTVQELVQSGQHAHVKRASALQLPFPDNTFDAIITDPPVYDNVSHADLSDFFYVWLKRSIGFLYPEHLRSLLTPKEQEVVMAASRWNQNKKVAKQNYERMIAQTFVEAHRVLKPGAPLVCIYTENSKWGLTTLTDALRHAGFVLIETWPLDTEMTSRSILQDRETPTSNIILVARRRENHTPRDLACSEQAEITSECLDTLFKEEITGADRLRASLSVAQERSLPTRTRLFFEDLENRSSNQAVF